MTKDKAIKLAIAALRDKAVDADVKGNDALYQKYMDAIDTLINV